MKKVLVAIFCLVIMSCMTFSFPVYAATNSTNVNSYIDTYVDEYGRTHYIYEGPETHISSPDAINTFTPFEAQTDQQSRALTGAWEYDYTGHNGIQYLYSGHVQSLGGHNIAYHIATGELSEGKIAQLISNQYMPGNTLLYSPTAKYNCHSFAWYWASSGNTYWINPVSLFMSDPYAALISPSNVQNKDIIVYFKDDIIQHSGIVIIDGNEIVIESKWGQGGVYRHAIEDVPDEYLDNGCPDVLFYRYHDYSYQYTGLNFHKGASHHYQYAYICSICQNTYGHTMEVIECDGPPCINFSPFAFDYSDTE